MLDSILKEIEAERNVQRILYTKEHDSKHTKSDWICLITRHIGLAVDDGSRIPLDRYKKQLTRVAALVIAALENLGENEKVIDQTIHGSGV